MVHPYKQMYLNDTMQNLADAFYTAANIYNYELDFFLEMLIVSGIATQFEHGNPKYLVGKSGAELVADVTDLVYANSEYKKITSYYNEPDEHYWTGWALAYYQWRTGKSFKVIQSIITMKQLCSLYHPYHEMDEEAVAEYIDNCNLKRTSNNRLQTYRKLLGLSQRELANESEVNLRTLQQYEIGAKDIKKASASTLISLGKILKCDPTDLCT